MSVFIIGFWILVVLCGALYLYTRQKVPTNPDPNFRSFQWTYLIVYIMAMAGDWLQGPYVYALYAHYGMTPHEIEILFVAGFGSSMLFGTVVGSFADKYGRRNNCILYGILYGLSCVTKHFNHFWILMLGRLLGGIATSILYSAFESWLIYEHNKRGFESEYLGTIFSYAVLGNSLVAITAGLVAQQFADVFGYVAPFDVALSILVLMCVLLIFTWTENYGDTTANPFQSWKNAAAAIKSDPKILSLGLIQSLFEGSMYTFVLEWTPALTPHQPSSDNTGIARSLLSEDDDGHIGTIPHGYIFAAFMVAVMIGASLYNLFTKHSKEESFMRPVLFVSALSLVTPVLFPGNQTVIFSGFLVFETCVGVFWPSLGTMRGRYVPEATRATIMNFFRIPLNLIVILILTQNLSMAVIFKCCVGFLMVATVCQHWLYSNALKCMPATKAAEASAQVIVPEEKKAPVTEAEA